MIMNLKQKNIKFKTGIKLNHNKYKAEKNRCRELGVLPKFDSKPFGKKREYPSADDFEDKAKKDFMVFNQRDLL